MALNVAQTEQQQKITVSLQSKAKALWPSTLALPSFLSTSLLSLGLFSLLPPPHHFLHFTPICLLSDAPSFPSFFLPPAPPRIPLSLFSTSLSPFYLPALTLADSINIY